MDVDMNFKYGYCDTCGTQVVRDPDTLAEVHLDITYANCGIEGEITPLADRIEGVVQIPQPRRRHLRAL